MAPDAHGAQVLPDPDFGPKNMIRHPPLKQTFPTLLFHVHERKMKIEKILVNFLINTIQKNQYNCRRRFQLHKIFRQKINIKKIDDNVHV
jgi:hypothetical protein